MNKTFSSGNHINDDEEDAASTTPESCKFKCDKCSDLPTYFPSFSKLRLHLREVHGDGASNDERARVQDFDNNEAKQVQGDIDRKMDNSSEGFRCISCDFKTYFIEDLREHMVKEKHNDEPSAICSSCKEKIHIGTIEKHYNNCTLFILYK